MDEHLRLTMYKNNSQTNSKINGCSQLQLLQNLTGKKSAIGYYSFTNSCGALNPNDFNTMNKQ